MFVSFNLFHKLILGWCSCLTAFAHDEDAALSLSSFTFLAGKAQLKAVAPVYDNGVREVHAAQQCQAMPLQSSECVCPSAASLFIAQLVLAKTRECISVLYFAVAETEALETAIQDEEDPLSPRPPLRAAPA